MSFKTNEPLLENVLGRIALGDIQLPEFQRAWVWDDAHIRSLLASVSLSYPIGAVMFLEAGGVPFKPRLFEGVSVGPANGPKVFVLDGQQRLTSMYLALRSGRPVRTRTEKGDDIERVYFLDMQKCLDGLASREDAVRSLPPNLKITSDFGRTVELDLSTMEKQHAQRMVPVTLFFNDNDWMEWKMAFAQHPRNVNDPMFLMRFENDVWLAFKQFKIPVIELSSDTPREAVCQVFEKVNTGGVTLTIFELVTATFAASNHDLRADWHARRDRLLQRHEVLEALDGTSFLTAVTLLSSYERHLDRRAAISCKRADVLDLELAEFNCLADRVERGMQAAAGLLAEAYVFDERSLPYATQLVPLGAICAHLGEGLARHDARERIMRWFWSGVFGELYGGANESRFAMDIVDVLGWIEGGDEPRTVRDSSFVPTRLLSLQSRLAAAYKGLAALIMRSGCEDFLTGSRLDINNYFNNAIDIHHIFPRKWCEKNGLPRAQWNSIVNKTPLAASTNRSIGGHAPSSYLERIHRDSRVPMERLHDRIKTHAIDFNHLRADDFASFLRSRAGRLLGLIEAATGRTVAGRDSEETVRAFGDRLA